MGRGFSRSSPCWGLAPRVRAPNPGTASAGLVGDRTCAAPRLTPLQTPPSGPASGRSLPRRGTARLLGAAPFSHAASPGEMSASPSAPCRLARSRPRIPAGLPWLSEAAGQEATSWAPRAVTGAETRAPSSEPRPRGGRLVGLFALTDLPGVRLRVPAEGGPRAARCADDLCKPFPASRLARLLPAARAQRPGPLPNDPRRPGRPHGEARAPRCPRCRLALGRHDGAPRLSR